MRLPVGFLSVCMVISFLNLPVSADESLTGRAIAEYQAENYEEAIALLQRQKAENPSSLVSYYLGLSMKNAGDSKTAAANLRDATNAPAVPEAYPELIQVLYGLNELPEAAGWVARAEEQRINPPRIAFLKGLILAKDNRGDEAAAAFNQARALDAGLTQAVDFQIAMLYAKERNITAARDSLKAVIAIDPTSEIASFARDYETAIRNLEDRLVWRYTASAAYQFDDNVVLKPSPDIPGVEITGQADSGLVAVGKVEYTPLLNGPWFFNGQFNLYTDTYLHTPSHNLIAPSLVLNPGRNVSDGAVSLPLVYRYSLLDERRYEGMLLFRPTYTRTLSPGRLGQVSLGYARRDLYQTSIDPEENRDGDIYVASVGYIQPFAGARGAFDARFEYSRDITGGRNWENTGNKIDLSLLAPLADQINLVLSGEANYQQFSNVHTIFGVKRRDPAYSGAANLIWQLSGRCSLNLQYAHTTVDSNIPLYKYDRNIYSAGTECRF